MTNEDTPITNRHCSLCTPGECCDGTGMLVAREVPHLGHVYECMHCDRKAVPVKENH